MIFVILPSLAFSQKLEIGLFGGSSNYKGDINKVDYVYLPESQLAYGFQAEYHIWDKIGIEGNFVMGKISGDDRNFEDRFEWGVSFQSSFVEALGKINYYPMRSRDLKVYDKDGNQFTHKVMYEGDKETFDMNGNPIHQYKSVFVATDSLGNEWIYNKRGDYVIMDSDRIVIEEKYNSTWSPYAYTGAGVSYFSPTVDGLVGAEGGIAPELLDGYYSKIHLTVPAGIGLRWDFAKQFAVGIEGGIRYAFSDYIDGISDSRDPQNNDWYYVYGINFRFKLGKEATITF